MNKHFINTFKQINFGKVVDIHNNLKNGKIKEITITDSQKENIYKYMLKSEYVQSCKDNEIIIATNNSCYIFKFYNTGIYLQYRINCFTHIGKSEVIEYWKETK